MLIEDLIKRLENWHVEFLSSHSADLQQAITLLREYQAQQAAQRWIPVGERLPEISKDRTSSDLFVLTFWNERNKKVSKIIRRAFRYSEDGWCVDTVGDVGTSRIAYWMLQPTLPDEGVES